MRPTTRPVASLATLAAVVALAGCGSSVPKTMATTTAGATTSTTAATTSTVAATTTTTLPVTPDTRVTASGHDFTGTPVDPSAYATPELGVFFSSPSGKFQCGILTIASDTGASGDSGLAGCHGATAPLPPRPASCVDLDWGGGMEVDAKGAVNFLCVGGLVFGNGKDPGKVLPYGSTLTAGHFVCTTALNGVSCLEKASGHGFTIASGNNRQF